MRIELLEKLVLVLAVISVLVVGGIVTLFSIIPLRSGIPDVAIDSELATQDWLYDKRADVHGWQKPEDGVVMVIQGPQVPVGPSRRGADGVVVAANGVALPPPPTEYATDYFNASDSAPSSGQVIEGYPWLRQVEGVAYAQPQPVSPLLYRKYQTFEDAWNLSQEGFGGFVETEAGTAYEVQGVDPNSLLATRMGLQPGDRVISINGRPISAGANAGKQLYDQLKDETRFAVLVERNNQQVVLSFYVN
jgi:membrane-associated protease RseP (regulator of RpoE activity)